VAVVGAGIAGLAAAAELAQRATVTILDRLPVAGGVLGYEAAPVRGLEERCARAGVSRMLGTTAVRWVDRRLLTVGPQGIGWHECDHLVYAGGSRPATQAELRIAGPRLAGVLPASVALHFAEAGVLLGRRIVFVGAGDWAVAAARVITEADCHVTVVTRTETPAPEFRHDAFITGWDASDVGGSGRVSELVLERAGQRHRVTCDAVVLAEDPRPLRNVDGAVLEPADDVSFVQPIADTSTHEWAAVQARTATAQLFKPRIEVPV
jgi:NADPH-dependent 2,4-dienoyl-CoA reductase/sulfur reductase-like enzyme